MNSSNTGVVTTLCSDDGSLLGELSENGQIDLSKPATRTLVWLPGLPPNVIDATKGTYLHAKIAYLNGPNQIFINLKSDVAFVNELIEQMCTVYDAENTIDAIESPSQGEICAARYTTDNNWYRACVLGADGTKIKVCFVDWGNTDEVPLEHVKPLLPEYLEMSPKAIPVVLEGARNITAIELETVVNEFDNVLIKFESNNSPGFVVSMYLDGADGLVDVVKKLSNWRPRPPTGASASPSASSPSSLDIPPGWNMGPHIQGKCFNCNVYGHMKEYCPKISGNSSIVRANSSFGSNDDNQASSSGFSGGFGFGASGGTYEVGMGTAFRKRNADGTAYLDVLKQTREEYEKEGESLTKGEKVSAAERERRNALLASKVSERLDSKPTTSYNRSLKTVKELAQKQLASEQLSSNGSASGGERNSKTPPLEGIFTHKVYYSCTQLGVEKVTRDEFPSQISSRLSTVSPIEAATRKIVWLNQSEEKKATAKETLLKMVKNLIEHPDEEKYRTIKLDNKAIKERIASVEGGVEYLQSVGFESSDDGSCLVIGGEKAKDMGRLHQARRALVEEIEPLVWKIHRDVKVLKSSDLATEQLDVADDYFELSAEELKKEQERLAKEAELQLSLRTGQMRAVKPPKHKYSCIRVKLPDGDVLQGTFLAQENLSQVQSFVQENLDSPMDFTLTDVLGKPLSQDDSLGNLKLAPGALLTFKPAQSHAGKNGYLKMQQN